MAVRSLFVGALLFGTSALCGPAGKSLDATKLFQKASQSVVMVVVETKTGLVQGSGVVIFSGRVVTNRHVVEQASGSIAVKHGTRTWPAVVLQKSVRADLAILDVFASVTTPFDLPVVARRDSDQLLVGERAYAIGAPRGLEQTLSEGIISGRSLRDSKIDVVQTTAAISPGSSGGGLFDAAGNLIGVTTLMLRESQALNFAVPITEVERLMLLVPLPKSLSNAEADSVEENARAPKRLPKTLGSLSCLSVAMTVSKNAEAAGITQAWAEIRLRSLLASAQIPLVKAAVKPLPAQCGIFFANIEITGTEAQTTYALSAYLVQIVDFANGELDAVTTWQEQKREVIGREPALSAVANGLETIFAKFVEERRLKP